MRTLYRRFENGIYSCDEVDITVGQWKEILTVSKDSVRQAVFDFLRLEDHAGSCTQACLEYGKPTSSYISLFNSLALNCKKRFDFEVKTSDGESVNWLVPMEKGYEDSKDKTFKWYLRKELVLAAQEFLVEELIKQYMSYVNSIGSLKVCDELYKWQLISACKGLDLIEMAKQVAGSNLVDAPRAGVALQTLAKEQRVILETIIHNLIYEGKDLDVRLEDYRSAFSRHWKKDEYGTTKPSDERSASALLTCSDPLHYTFYKSEVYEIFCKYIGEEIEPAGKKYTHYLQLLKTKLLPNLLAHTEFMNRLHQETDQYVRSELLNAQDVLWQMQDFLKEKTTVKAHWMAGYNWGYSNDRSQEFIDKGFWEGGSSKGNTNNLIKSAKKGDILFLKSAYTKGSDHKTSVLKIIAVGKVLDKAEKIDEEHYRLNVEYRKITPKEFTDFKGSYLGTFHRVKDPQFIEMSEEILSTPENTLHTMKYKAPSVKVQELIKLLKNAGQIILQGAPGCGKTYITTELAVALCDDKIPEERKDLKARYKELQNAGRIAFTTFHQSLDYEDFVEGLKPDTESNSDDMRFIVKHGIFRRICEAATSKETSNFEEAYAAFLQDLEKKEDVTEIVTSSGTKFGVKVNSNGNLSLHTGNNLQYNGTLTKEKIANHLDNKYWQTYYTGVFDYLKTNYNLRTEDKEENLPYVLIIDEINRANISKVLGELITLLEKSKRLGAEDEVSVTLPYSGDTFGVPANLYIIGTMNTADRSVGYIDYAIRRRFAFKTLTNDTSALREFYKTELHNDLYDKEINLITDVRNIIKDHLNRDFQIDDIMLGHSYFMAGKPEDYSMNLEYKIKPLLKEYLRDGILVEKGNEVSKAIDNLK